MDFFFDHLKATIISVTVGLLLIAVYLMTSTTSAPAFGSTAYVQNAIMRHPHSFYWQLLENGEANLGFFGGLSAHRQKALFVDAILYCDNDPATDPLHGTCQKIIQVADSPF